MNATSTTKGHWVRRIPIRWMLAGAVLLLAALATRWVFRRGEAKMQTAFDAMRMRDVHALAERIVAFRDAVGRCPLGHLVEGRPVTVLLAHRPPVDWPAEAPEKLPASFLEEDLAATEGTGRGLPIDPQMQPYDFWPAIQYETDGQDFVLGVSLYHPREGAVRRGEHWYKFDLTAPCAPDSGRARPIHAR